MSFRFFIYYCALCGGWAAFVGWAFGRLVEPASEVARDGIRGMFLGLFVALGLSFVDALWNLSLRQVGQVFMRVGTAVLVGCVGGLIGGMLGSALYEKTNLGLFFVFGWTLVGLLVGAAIGVFEILSSVVQQQSVSGSTKKMLKALIGGTLGGLIGGVLALLMRLAWRRVFEGKDENALWSPTALGFVALGMCIGLLIGLAQVILKEAWIRIEVGRRAGKEMILTKDKTTIGRAEACDIGLFGDHLIEKLHAWILQSGNRYYLEDGRSPVGTFVNDRPVVGRTPLQSGDLIRVGNSVLRFREKKKRR